MLAADHCQAIDEAGARAKGYAALVPPLGEAPQEAWSVELHLGLGSRSRDAYTHRLGEFGFYDARGLFDVGDLLRWQLAVARQLGPHLSLVADVRNYDSGKYDRDIQSTHDKTVLEHFRWASYALAVHLRAHVDLFHQTLRFYAQLGAGAGLVHSNLESTPENYVGPVLAAAAGFFYMPFRSFGFTFEAGYAYAPVLRNELSDHHDSGGLALCMGLRYRTWSSP